MSPSERKSRINSIATDWRTAQSRANNSRAPSVMQKAQAKADGLARQLRDLGATKNKNGTWSAPK
jgi:hypothetical protein